LFDPWLRTDRRRLILLWGGSGFPVHARLVAAAVVLPPRIAPLLLSALAGPGDFSFVLNPSPPATSSSAWGWYGLLWAVCALLMLMFSEKGNALLAGAGIQQPSAPVTRHERAPVLLIIPALLVLAWATNALLGLKNEFEWVEAANAAPGIETQRARHGGHVHSGNGGFIDGREGPCGQTHIPHPICAPERRAV
jgi:hypothetical protein